MTKPTFILPRACTGEELPGILAPVVRHTGRKLYVYINQFRQSVLVTEKRLRSPEKRGIEPLLVMWPRGENGSAK